MNWVTQPGCWLQECADDPYLLLNTVADQIYAFSPDHFSEPKYPGQFSFMKWYKEQTGEEIDPFAFASRKSYGLYLRYAYKTLLDNIPPNMELVNISDMAKAPDKAKFANPEDATQTWTGKGRRPDWSVAAMTAGKTPDDLAI